MKSLEPDDLELTRREVVRLLGSFAAAGMLGCAGTGAREASESPTTPASPVGTCVVRPQQTEGPFFVDERLNRSDLRSDPATGLARPGVPLTVRFRVSRTSAGLCGPLVGALVDLWQCDATGSYSDIGATAGAKFLRGYQVTDSSGVAKFTTIYPGWYQGRAVHIHFKIRSHTGSGSAYEFTSQLFFDDSITDQVYTQAPYNTRGQRTLRNSGDGIYNQGGSQLLLAPAKAAEGYSATFDIGLQMS